MDCVLTWDYNSLINELTQGLEHTKQLRTYLSSVASTSEATPEFLLQKILSSYEQSLLILKWSGSASQSLQPLPPTGGAIEPPPASADRSPRGDDKKRSFKDHPELMIHISKRRSYYKCRYWILQGCGATKQIQRSDDDPTVVEITYKAFHICHEVTNSAIQPKSSEKQANHQTQTGGGYSPSFVSPTTAESNCLSVSGCQINSFGIVHNHSESYLTDIGIIQNLYHSDSDRTNTFSANTSTTSSSIAGVDVRWTEFWQVKVG